MASSLSTRQFTMVPGQDIDPLFLCPICQDSWADPVELVPCGDIFCQACIREARARHGAQPMIMENFQCPQCHTVVQSEKKPNRMLLNTVLEVEVECRYCQWRGTREASSQHDCDEGKKQKQTDAAAAARAGQSPEPNAVLQLSSSTAPLPSKAHAPRRVSGASPQPAEPALTPPGLRGPRRAVQEIEGAFTAIEDDPTSTTFRLRAASPSGTSTAVSYDYGFGMVQSSMNNSGGGGGGGGVGSFSGTVADAAGNRDAVLTSPPSSSSNVAPSTPGSVPTSALRAAEPWRRYRLAQIEYDQLVGIFMLYDDGTGRLNHQQLRDLCFCMNFVQREEDVSVIFRAMDTAHKGYVTQEDFLLWLSTHRPDPSALFGLTQFEYTDAILQFRSVDPEFNGVIDANDFCAICLTNGYARTPDEAMRFFHMCDDRHTGYVSLQQYLRMLKTIKGAAGRVGGNTSYGAASSGGANTPLRTAGSSGSGHGGMHASGGGGNGGGDNSFASASPQGSDYWTNDRPPYPPQQQQQQQQPQPSMFDYYPPSGQQPQQPQRFVTSLNSFPGDVQHQQQLQQQRQQVLQQQPYSQMGRSTIPMSPQQPAVPATAALQSGTQHQRSRLHRPSARPQRDEECVIM